jgi:hypothetical protein
MSSDADPCSYGAVIDAPIGIHDPSKVENGTIICPKISGIVCKKSVNDIRQQKSKITIFSVKIMIVMSQ